MLRNLYILFIIVIEFYHSLGAQVSGCDDVNNPQFNPCVDCSTYCTLSQNVISCSYQDTQSTTTNCNYQCDDPDCLDVSCQYPNICTTCDSNGYYNQQGFCMPCLANCNSCSNDLICGACKNGFFLNNSQTECVVSCGSGYYQQTIPTAICLDCLSNCETCQNSNTCQTCWTGHYLQNSDTQCVNECGVGFYENIALGTCTSCISNCQDCSNGSTCTTCQTGFYLQNSNSQCVSECGIGFYEALGICRTCLNDCEICSDQQTCSLCIQNYYSFGNTLCLATCPPNYYGNDPQRQCDLCLSNCETCTNASNCQSCQSSYYLKNDTQCLQTCGDQFYADPSSRTCEPCFSNCQTCTNGTTCQSCQQAYYLNNTNTQCVNGCGNSYYQDNVSGTCTPCLSNCDSCSNSQSCITCQDPGYYRDNLSVCQICDSNCRGCVNSSTTCTSCLDGSYLINNTCALCNATVCNKCIDNANKCLECAADVHFVSVNVCGNCSFGQFANSSDYCQDCDSSSCLTCLGQSISCTTCVIGKYLSGTSCSLCDQKCHSCSTSSTNCQSCNQNYSLYNQQCLENCPSGFFSNVTTRTCDSCSQSCIQCQNQSNYCTICQVDKVLYQNQCIDQCPLGYFQDINRECQQCNSNCLACTQSASNCIACKTGVNNTLQPSFSCLGNCDDGYYKRDEQYSFNDTFYNFSECLLCHSSCTKCFNETANDCSECNTNNSYYLFDTTCNSSCPTSYYPNTTTGNCTKCDSSCLTCENEQSCTSCNTTAEYYIIPQSSGLCYPCPISEGYFILQQTPGRILSPLTDNHDRCQKCDTSCKTCSYSNCTSCHQGFYLFYQTDSINNITTYECLPCPANCTVCFYDWMNNVPRCTSCVDQNNQFLDQNLTCINNCPSPEYLSLQLSEYFYFVALNQQKLIYYQQNSTFTNNICDSCQNIHYGCKYCNQESGCYECQSAYYKQNSSCLDQCSDGFYPDVLQKICQPCDDTCNTCTSSGPNHCSSCQPFLFLYQNQCSAQCPSVGFYENVTTNECSPCHGSCNECFGPENYECLNCANDLKYLSNQNTCLDCPQDCLTCFNASLCFSCAQNRYLNPNSQCLANCPDGFYSQQNICKPCDLNCKTCSFIQNNCTSCLSNQQYLDPQTNMCQNCRDLFSNCSSCSYKSCQECQSPYYLSPQLNVDLCPIQRCLLNCEDGYYKQAETGQCVLCQISGCLKCSDSIRCLECRPGYELLDSYTCFSQCPESNFLQSDNTTCSPCDDSCLNCFNDTPSSCTSCLQGKYLNSSFYCIDACPSDNFVQNGICISCHSSCQTCSGAFQNNCLSCPQNISHLYQQNNTCLNFCPTGFFINTDNNTCQTCHLSCSACDGPFENNCTSCHELANFFPLNKTCLNQCPDGFYEDSYTEICQTCHTPCQTCQSLEFCISCLPNYYLLNGGCLSACPLGYFINNLQICQVCSQQNCLSCDVDDVCQSCMPGYFKSIEGDCIICDENCLFCQNNSTNCLACTSEKFLNPYTAVCQDCPLSQYYLENVCQDCSNHCQTCQNSSYCTECSTPYILKQNACILGDCGSGFLFFQINKTCNVCSQQNCASCQDVDPLCAFCQEGFYLTNESTCQTCPENCTSCLNQTYCSTCSGQTQLNINVITNQQLCVFQEDDCQQNFGQSCINCNQTYCTQCSPPTFLNQNNSACLDCDIENCVQCGGGDSDLYCSTCEDNFYQFSTLYNSSFAATSCLAECPDNYRINQYFCEQCEDQNCQNCSLSKETCETCYSLFQFVANLSSCQCPYFLSVGNTCLPCVDAQNCLHCSESQDDCQLCVEEKVNQNGTCQDSCDQDFYPVSQFFNICTPIPVNNTITNNSANGLIIQTLNPFINNTNVTIPIQQGLEAISTISSTNQSCLLDTYGWDYQNQGFMQTDYASFIIPSNQNISQFNISLEYLPLSLQNSFYRSVTTFLIPSNMTDYAQIELSQLFECVSNIEGVYTMQLILPGLAESFQYFFYLQSQYYLDDFPIRLRILQNQLSTGKWTVQMFPFVDNCSLSFYYNTTTFACESCVQQNCLVCDQSQPDVCIHCQSGFFGDSCQSLQFQQKEEEEEDEEMDYYAFIIVQIILILIPLIYFIIYIKFINNKTDTLQEGQNDKLQKQQIYNLFLSTISQIFSGFSTFWMELNDFQLIQAILVGLAVKIVVIVILLILIYKFPKCKAYILASLFIIWVAAVAIFIYALTYVKARQEYILVNTFYILLFLLITIPYAIYHKVQLWGLYQQKRKSREYDYIEKINTEITKR